MVLLAQMKWLSLKNEKRCCVFKDNDKNVFYKLLFVLSGRFGDLYGRAGDSGRFGIDVRVLSQKNVAEDNALFWNWFLF